MSSPSTPPQGELAHESRNESTSAQPADIEKQEEAPQETQENKGIIGTVTEAIWGPSKPKEPSASDEEASPETAVGSSENTNVNPSPAVKAKSNTDVPSTMEDAGETSIAPALQLMCDTNVSRDEMPREPTSASIAFSPTLPGREDSTRRQASAGAALENGVPSRPTTPAVGPRRSVTITEGRPSDARRGRRSDRGGADDGKVRRSQSAARRSASVVRRSLSIGGRSEGPVDPLREPRRSISKRPEEFDLRARDPHTGTHFKSKGIHREVAFAAPYSKSGVVLREPAKWKHWMIPGPLTLGHGQWWYLTVGQSFLAAVISGAANFGVACATYNHYDRSTEIKFWKWYPVPLAGDMGVTVIIQQIISMLITSALVHHDLTDGPIGPLRRPWPPLLHLPATPSPQGSWLGIKLPREVEAEGGKPLYMGKAEGKGKFSQYWWWFVRSMLTGSERNDLFARGISWRQRIERILWTAVQGFVLCVLTFWWFWPIAIAIVAPIYEHRNLSGTYIPAIIKLLYGAIMSMLTNPIMALLAMGAESSVRRAYPELPIWQPFGGDADYQAWLVEQHIPEEDVEIGPRGIARSSTQIQRERDRENNRRASTSRRQSRRRSQNSTTAAGSMDMSEVEGGTVLSAGDHAPASEDGDETPRTPGARNGRLSARLSGGHFISRAITEEPANLNTVSTRPEGSAEAATPTSGIAPAPALDRAAADAQ